ncbi:hypothetical protein P7C73_g6770, partial [Tremellales sp. Uapishka_1]
MRSPSSHFYQLTKDTPPVHSPLSLDTPDEPTLQILKPTTSNSLQLILENFPPEDESRKPSLHIRDSQIYTSQSVKTPLFTHRPLDLTTRSHASPETYMTPSSSTSELLDRYAPWTTTRNGANSQSQPCL